MKTSPTSIPADSAERVARWVRPEIRALRPYHVPDAGGLIKLDAMENPYSWPEELLEEWLTRLGDVAVNRYPDAAASKLKQRLRQVMGVPAGMDIMLGNGSDELIQIIDMAVAGGDRCVLAPVPSFVMYEMIARAVGLRFVGVPLDEEFHLRETAMLEAIERHRPAVVYLAYPNNPTGNLFASGVIERMVRASDGLVVVDEAYAAFTDASYMQRLQEFGNLLVMRTVSKLGLAGLRLGMLAGAPAWISEFEKIRLPYNINSLTQVSAEFMLQHPHVFDRQIMAIREERARLAEALDELPQVETFPSETNFILFRVSGKQADQVFNALREQGVLIKNLHKSGGALAGCLRVTVGTPGENDTFLQALRKIL